MPIDKEKLRTPLECVQLHFQEIQRINKNTSWNWNP